MGIPSSNYFDQNQYGKQLPAGWNTLKITSTKIKDLVSRRDQQTYPCLIIDLISTDGIEHAIFLKTDDTANFDWAGISRVLELTWQDDVEIESIKNLFDEQAVGQPFDAFITHSKPNAEGKIFVNIKEYAPAGTGGGNEEEVAVAVATPAEPAPSKNGKKRF